MGFLDRLFGRKTPQDQQGGWAPQQGQPQQEPPAQQGVPQQGGPQDYPAQPGYHQQPAPAAYSQPPQQQGSDADQQAIQRYEYLLRTARPEQIEQAHTEAFAQLTPAQRQQVLQKLAQESPQEAPRDDSPQSLARSATRIEMQRPGTLQRAFGGPGLGGRAGGAGLGMGGMLLTSVAGAFIGTAIAQEIFDNNDVQGEGEMADDQGNEGDQGGDAGQGDAGAEQAAYGGGGQGGDAGSDGGWGGDSGGSDGGGGFDGGGFGGGDFGGGDFGGGDFGGGF